MVSFSGFGPGFFLRFLEPFTGRILPHAAYAGFR